MLASRQSPVTCRDLWVRAIYKSQHGVHAQPYLPGAGRSSWWHSQRQVMGRCRLLTSLIARALSALRAQVRPLTGSKAAP
jgi:hypothetical protein